MMLNEKGYYFTVLMYAFCLFDGFVGTLAKLFFAFGGTYSLYGCESFNRKLA
jgi:hypothetical protein